MKEFLGPIPSDHLLPLKRQCSLDIEVLAILIQWRDYRDARLPGNPPVLLIAPAVQKVYPRLLLYAFLHPFQHLLQLGIF
jgi:hypothetical protein